VSDDSEVEEYLHELALLDEIESVLEGVDAALRRLDDGTFGRCEVCGAELDRARLGVDPLLTVCDAHGAAPIAPAPPAPPVGPVRPATPDTPAPPVVVATPVGPVTAVAVATPAPPVGPVPPVAAATPGTPGAEPAASTAVTHDADADHDEVRATGAGSASEDADPWTDSDDAGYNDSGGGYPDPGDVDDV
jgi:hypothetical protein